MGETIAVSTGGAIDDPEQCAVSDDGDEPTGCCSVQLGEGCECTLPHLVFFLEAVWAEGVVLERPWVRRFEFGSRAPFPAAGAAFLEACVDDVAAVEEE